MKKILILLLTSIVFTSCESYFGDVNVDPNRPSSATPATILPAVETSIAYTYWGDVSRYASICSQHLKGNDRQFIAYNNYVFLATDYNTVWDNVYADALKDINTLQVTSATNGNEMYAGIANVLAAYNLLLATSLWGDIPYSEAIKGADNQKPKYDTQSDIFTAIFKLLDDSKAGLSSTKGAKPGTDDIIFAGNLDKWKMFGEGIRARAYLQLGKKDAANYQKALDAANASFKSKADEAGFSFLTPTQSNAPWYQYNIQRGDNVVNPTILSLMPATDVRKAAFSQDLPGNDKHTIFTNNQNVRLLSYAEIQFIIAEASKRTSKDAAALTALQNGVKASCEIYGLTATAEMTSGLTGTLTEILTQKYYSELMNPQAWFDWRRTGVPTLKPNSGTAIPVRFLYPLTEVNYNANATNGKNSLYTPLWINN
jgi:hypothetical protein